MQSTISVFFFMAYLYNFVCLGTPMNSNRPPNVMGPNTKQQIDQGLGRMCIMSCREAAGPPLPSSSPPKEATHIQKESKNECKQLNFPSDARGRKQPDGLQIDRHKCLKTWTINITVRQRKSVKTEMVEPVMSQGVVEVTEKRYSKSDFFKRAHSTHSHTQRH